MAQLRSLKQGENESVREYVKRRQTIVVCLERHGCPISTIDELTTFEQGLKPEIQRHLRSSVKTASSFKEAVAAAEAFEEAENLYELKRNSSAQTRIPQDSINIVSNRSTQADHDRMSLRQDLPSQRYTPRPRQPQCSGNTNVPQCSGNTNVFGMGPRNTILCHECGGAGHIARECPSRNRNITCYSCQRYGHFARDCPFQTNQKVHMQGQGYPSFWNNQPLSYNQPNPQPTRPQLYGAIPEFRPNNQLNKPTGRGTSGPGTQQPPPPPFGPPAFFLQHGTATQTDDATLTINQPNLTNIKVEINGQVVPMVLDSGSSVSLIDYNYYTTLKGSGSILEEIPCTQTSTYWKWK